MKEELQIEQAARLADTDAPENIYTERARAFVSKTIEAGKTANERRPWFQRFFNERPVLAWGSSAFAFTAAAAIALALFLPSNGVGSGVNPVFEMESIHATSEVADTTVATPADTLESFQIPVAE